MQIDKEFQSYLRQLSAEEFSQLEQNIKANGCREPLVVWKNGGDDLLLDGHHRKRICEKHSISFNTKAIQLPDRQAAIDWIIDNQAGRRNLTPTELSYYRGKQYERRKQSHGGTGANQYKQTRQNDGSATKLAKAHGVSDRTIERDAAFAKAVDELEKAEPGTRQKVLSGNNEQNKKEILRKAKLVQEKRTISKEYYLISDWSALPLDERIRLIQESTGKSSLNAQDGDSIEWARWSWNPVTGCKHNCPYCYARDIAFRFYDAKFEPAFYPSRLNAPQNQKVPASALHDIGYKNIFVCSMADLFGKWVPKEWIDAVLWQCLKNPQWNFLFLTKFPHRLTEFEFSDNCWVGTSVDCQNRVASAEQAMAKVKAKVRWLSCEPFIEPLRFKHLDLFQWIVIGGASESQPNEGTPATPSFWPPAKWLSDFFATAHDAGATVYLKTNGRPREYPGMPDHAMPEALRYLPKDNK